MVSMDHNHTSLDISSLFQTAEEIQKPEEVGVNGTIPNWLRGHLIQIGPGKLDLSKCTLNNWLDGYGILTKFEIKDGPLISLQSKYVKTEAYEKSVAAGRPIYTEYGTAAQSEGRKSLFSKIVSTLARDDMSDNCSASLYQIQDHLCASAATCYFYEVDPSTLDTKERYDAKKLLGQNGFGVHPIADDEGNLWNMGFTVVPSLKYNIIKIPGGAWTKEDQVSEGMDKVLSHAKTVASISSRWTGAIAFNHSFGMTKDYIIFIEQPYVVKVSRVLASKVKEYCVKDWLEWRPEDKNRFYIVEKVTGKIINVEMISKDSFFFMHVVNCYQDGNQIILDLSTSKDPTVTDATGLEKLRQNILHPVEPIKIQRYILPLHSENVKDFPENRNLLQNIGPNCKATAVRHGNILILSPDDLTEKGIDRTSINLGFSGKKYTYLYGSGSFIFSNNDKTNSNGGILRVDDSTNNFSVAKINLETKEIKKVELSSQGLFPGEPLFVPRENKSSQNEDTDEDDGVVLYPVESVRPDQNNFLLFVDAKSFKELGRATFTNRIPGGMHSIFIPK